MDFARAPNVEKWVHHLRMTVSTFGPNLVSKRNGQCPVSASCPTHSADSSQSHTPDSSRSQAQNDTKNHVKWDTDEDITNELNRLAAQAQQEQLHAIPRPKRRLHAVSDDALNPSPNHADSEAPHPKRRSLSPEHETSHSAHTASSQVQVSAQFAIQKPHQRASQGQSVPVASSAASQQTRQPPPQPNGDELPATNMMLQPETRPISQDQLVAEVKGIYAGLVMVETKCIEVDNAQSYPNAKTLNNEQWQTLIALHRTLLHEHHDFFLASQHPSASLPLRRLASKYAMPARMWRHGIHSFLELLRHRLPASREHMLTFLYLAYSMMALLYETVPAFVETWIECLGDLGRYRMAIEDDDIKDREVWTGVSQHWYSKASDQSSDTGRLYHHLAILARPNALQQLYYYAKSLCVPIPFLSARESVMTLFDPIFESDPRHLSKTDTYFVRVHGILFSGKGDDKMLAVAKNEFSVRLDETIARSTKKWLEAGYFMGIATACSLLGYGIESNVLMRAMSQKSDETDVAMDGSSILETPPSKSFTQALDFAVKTYDIVLRRWGDTNTLPFIHTILVFMLKMTQYPAGISYLEKSFPWKLTMVMLNYLLDSCDFEPRMNDFPGPEKGEHPRPLPEDYAMRGLTYAADYHPKDWFDNGKIDEDEKYFELASMTDQRKERILYLGYKIAAQGKWLTYDTDSKKFDVMPAYNVKIDEAIDHSLESTSDLIKSE
ncbi:hypothetical protein EDB81DRAFT_845454 [Dactylonectria macrodidyma]|uniref:DNA/RNA-binding domain-containing protein n=1 Tax=Dactylonectria macrodidyma TaxID=307937 RepID=A0A9P9E8G0_9HYPO|nr:hypothetical protein EDB81DRAFT_845454 [Dactylonectria macrodidyma]